MRSLGCCGQEKLTARLNDQQRVARAVIGVGSLAVAARTRRKTGALSSVCAVGAGWFGVSHLVAAQTRYAGCLELGAILSLALRREVQVGCVPWRAADRRLGLVA
jgi:hypothetical protein